MLDDLRLDACVQRRARDDLLEQTCVDASGAGEGDQPPARSQQLERQQVDVLVAARGSFGLCGGWRELGRVEDDQVEGAILVAESAQELKDIAFEYRVTSSIQAVEGDIFAAEFQCLRRRVDREYRFR